MVHAKRVADLGESRRGECSLQERVDELAKTVPVEVLNDVANEEAKGDGTDDVDTLATPPRRGPPWMFSQSTT
jgi:hypothetical protein